jgi:hypothetical protein
MKVGILFFIIVVMFVGMAVFSSAARAELVTIAIEGVVDYVNDPFGLVAGEITAGGAITGTYTYDLTTPDSNPLGEVGDYEHRSAPSGIRMSVGGHDFTTDPGNVNFLIETIDNYGGDAFLLVSYNNLFPLEGIIFTNISWTLGDDTENAFSSASLPTTAPNVLDWDYNFLQIGGSDSDIRVPGMKSFGMAGHITSAVVVPEPTTVFLVGLGMAGVRRRRGRK